MISRISRQAQRIWRFVRGHEPPPPQEAVELAERQAELMIRLELVGRQVGVQVRHPSIPHQDGRRPPPDQVDRSDRHQMAMAFLGTPRMMAHP